MATKKFKDANLTQQEKDALDLLYFNRITHTFIEMQNFLQDTIAYIRCDLSTSKNSKLVVTKAINNDFLHKLVFLPIDNWTTKILKKIKTIIKILKQKKISEKHKHWHSRRN